MKIKIIDIFKKFPDFNLIVIDVKNAKNDRYDNGLFELLHEVEDFVKLNFTKEKLSKFHVISAFEAAKKKLGKEVHFKTTVENLMDKVLNNKEIAQKNKLSDVISYIVLKHLLPVSICDKDKLHGNLYLRFAAGHESFGNEKVNTGEAIYMDDYHVLFRNWDFKENPDIKVDGKTKNALVFVDLIIPTEQEKIDALLDDLTSMLKNICDAEINVYGLDKDKQEVEL